MDVDAYQKQIELEILEIIKQRLKAQQMNANRAKQIAQYVLNTLRPHMDLNQIYDVVKNFDDHFPELVPVVLKVSRDYEEQIKKTVVEHVGNLIKQNKIGEANEILKKALNTEGKINARDGN